MTAEEPYAGMEVYTNDDQRVGRVRNAPGEGDPQPSDYLTIERTRARDIVVPRSILRVTDDHLVLPFGMTVVEGAPSVRLHRRAMTIEEKWILDSCYSLWTGVPPTRIEIVKDQYSTQEGERVDMNEKAKQATDRAKAGADQIIAKAKVQAAQLIGRSKVKEAELREKAEKQAADLREKAKQQAAGLRQKAKQDAAALREKADEQGAQLHEKAKQEASELRKKAKREAAELLGKAKAEAEAHRPKARVS